MMILHFIGYITELNIVVFCIELMFGTYSMTVVFFATHIYSLLFSVHAFCNCVTIIFLIINIVTTFFSLQYVFCVKIILELSIIWLIYLFVCLQWPVRRINWPPGVLEKRRPRHLSPSPVGMANLAVSILIP